LPDSSTLSPATFSTIERKTKRRIYAFSKHGSGRHKYGLHHYPPYEPEHYLKWGQESNAKIFFGNLEDPRMDSYIHGSLRVFPSAFWLEHGYRDTTYFTKEWLLNEAQRRDVVLLFHPDNVLADPNLLSELDFILHHG